MVRFSGMTAVFAQVLGAAVIPSDNNFTDGNGSGRKRTSNFALKKNVCYGACVSVTDASMCSWHVLIRVFLLRQKSNSDRNMEIDDKPTQTHP